MENQQKEIHSPLACISLPSYGGKVDWPFVECLTMALQTLSGKVIGMIDSQPGDSLVNRARNNLAHKFLKGFETAQGVMKYDWLLFLDTDLIFPPQNLQMVYDLGVKNGPGIYCGTYPIKQLRPKVVFNAMPGQVPDKDGVVSVREAGTGFMMIHRKVFEQMIEKFSDEMRYEADMGDSQAPRTIMYDFFSVGVRHDTLAGYKRFLSEDWYFCQRWREMGGKILMHTKVQCGHIGQFVYPGNPQDIIETGEILKKAMANHAASGAAPVLVKTVKAKDEEKPELVAVTD